MNRHVNAIAGRQSLRPPQRHSLEILDRITEIVPPRKGNELEGALTAIRSEVPAIMHSWLRAIFPFLGRSRPVLRQLPFPGP